MLKCTTTRVTNKFSLQLFGSDVLISRAPRKKKTTSCQVIAKADYVSLRAVYRANETRGGCQTSQVTPVCFSIPQRLEIVMEIEN